MNRPTDQLREHLYTAALCAFTGEGKQRELVNGSLVELILIGQYFQAAPYVAVEVWTLGDS